MPKLTGIPSLAYRGVEAPTPANTSIHEVDPTTQAYYGFNLGDYWLNVGTISAPLQRLWVLVNKANHIATWVLLVNGGGGPIVQLTASDATIARPLLGNITFPDQVIAGSGNVSSNLMSNVNPNLGPNFTFNLKPILNLPATAAVAGVPTAGVIEFNSIPVFHQFGSTNNVFIGSNSGNFVAGIGAANIGIGTSTGAALTTGARNVLIGNVTGLNITTGADNTSVGTGAMQLSVLGNENVAIGHATMQSSDGKFNSGVGSSVLFNLLTGDYNVAIGPAIGPGPVDSGAGFNYTTNESSNILISNAGTTGDNNIIRIGTSGGGDAQQNKCFIAGIRGITTDVNDAIAVLIDSAGQLGTVSSSIRFKEHVEDMASESNDIYKLRPVSFEYKNQSARYRSIGLIAEEVSEVMPRLVVFDKEGSPETVKYHDLPVLLLNELQKLSKRVAELESKLLDR